MEVPDGMADECGRLVWSRATSPANCGQRDGLQESTDFSCDLARMQRAPHIGCHHSVHLDVEELSPL